MGLVRGSSQSCAEKVPEGRWRRQGGDRLAACPTGGHRPSTPGGISGRGSGRAFVFAHPRVPSYLPACSTGQEPIGWGHRERSTLKFLIYIFLIL